MAQGLPSSKVNCIFQDSESYLWFGTDNGVAKFDGLKFKIFSIQDGLCNNEVLGIHEDSKGRVWFLSGEGCISYISDENILTVESQIQDLAEPFDILFMKEDAEGSLHFCGKGNTVFISDENLEHWTATSITTDLTSPSVYPIQDHQISYKTLNQNWSEIPENSSSVKWWFQSSTNQVYALTGTGIIKIATPDTITLIGLDQLPLLRSIDKIFVDTQENIYTISQIQETSSFSAKKNATQCFSKTNSGYLPTATSLSDDSFSSVYVDDEQNEWLASYVSGVHMISKSQKLLTHYERFKGERTSCLAQSTNGDIIIGSSGNSIVRFNKGERKQEIQIGPPTGSSKINDIYVDSVRNVIWCGGDFGMLKLGFDSDLTRDGVINITSFDFVPVREVFDILPESDTTLIFSSDKGIKRIKSNQNFSVPEPILSLELPSKTIARNEKGKIWYAQNQNLFSLENGVPTAVQISSNSFAPISRLTALNSKVLLVATFGNGVYAIADNQIIFHFNEENGLSSNFCNEIQITSEYIYLATNNGITIAKWESDQLKHLAVIDEKIGLPTNIINDVIIQDSLLYLASTGGLVIFDPEKIAKQVTFKQNPPKLDLTLFKSQNQIFQIGKEIKLNYDESFFQINYQAVSFDQPDYISYQYRFNPKEAWQTTSLTSLEIPKFEEGNYVFEIRAKKYNSDWCKPVGFTFSSLPPWWNTWWARALYLLTLIGIGFLIARFYARRTYERQLALLQKEQALLEERNRISADMHDDLGSELTKIVILSRIARTKLALPKEQEQPIVDIDVAASDIVKKMNEIIWALNPTNDTLESLIAYLQKYINDYLDVRDLGGRVILPDNIPAVKVKAAFRRNTFLIVKECLHNIHKHAQATKINTEIQITDELKISIRENGVGFDMEKTRRFGNGLNNMQKRAENINGNVIQKSEIGQGSELHLRIPLAKNHDFVLDKN